MDIKARIDFLSTHADRLIEGEHSARRFVQQQTSLSAEMRDLLSLAYRVGQALTPVAVPEPFRRQLRDDLLAHSEKHLTSDSERSLRPLWYSLAAAGSVLPLLGIFVWRRRRRSDTQTLVDTGWRHTLNQWLELPF